MAVRGDDPAAAGGGGLMLAWVMNLGFAGSETGAVFATKGALLLLGVGVLRLAALI